MKVTVSAPGKVHLSGEHGVVYGRPALLAAIDRRVAVTIQLETGAHHSRYTVHTDTDTHLFPKIWALLQPFANKNTQYHISVLSQIPVGAGCGSSAAIAVATCAALLYCMKKVWNPARINELAYEVEKYQHGDPSGGDNTIVTYGGLLWYRKEFEFLKSIWSLPILHYTFPPIVAIDSGKPAESTKEMVRYVARWTHQYPRRAKQVFDAQEICTKQLLLSFRSADIPSFCQVMQAGEKNLEYLGVVGQKAKRIIRAIEKRGGVAKISGAGGKKEGSGILLCYHKNSQVLFDIAKTFHAPAFPLRLGEEGVRLEEKHDG